MVPAYPSTSPLRAADRRSGPRALCLAQPDLTTARDAWAAAATQRASLGQSAGPAVRPTRGRRERPSFATMAMTTHVPSGLHGDPEHLLRWLEQRGLHGARGAQASGFGLGFRLDVLALGDLAPRVRADLEIPLAEQRYLVELWLRGDRLTHFQRLGLSPTCDQALIRRAYLAVARRLHPDRYYGKHLGRFADVLDELFHRARAARIYLADPRRCARYVGQLTEAGHAVNDAVKQPSDASIAEAPGRV